MGLKSDQDPVQVVAPADSSGGAEQNNANDAALDAFRQIFARIHAVELATGVVPSAVKSLPVAQLVSEYSTHKEPKCKRGGWVITRHRLANVARAWGALSVSDLSHDKIDEYIRGRIDGGVTRATAGQDVQAFSAAITWAVKRGKTPWNPLSGYEFDLQHGGRERIYTDDEIDAFLVAANRLEFPDMVAVIEIMRWTGVRPREIINSRRASLDFATGLLTVTAEVAKTGVERHVALMPRAVAAIKALPDSLWLIPAHTDQCKSLPYSTLNARWNKIADVSTVHREPGKGRQLLYSLRHSLATRLALEHGYGAFELCAALGWADVGMSRRYVKPGAAHALAMANKLIAGTHIRQLRKRR